MDRVREQLGINRIPVSQAKPQMTVAVLDSGIDVKHPDLTDSVAVFRDFVGGYRNPYDDYGHGTHVCGCIGGMGDASEGVYRGITPGMKFVVGKVLDYHGDGTIEHMIQGIKWVIEHKQEYQIRILNISVGTGKSYEDSEFHDIMKVLNLAWYQGIMVICAAGNAGPRKNSISAIGRNQNVLTVGCHDDGEHGRNGRPCEVYSGRGNEGGYHRKPDIVAPGTGIVSCSMTAGSKSMRKEKYYGAKSGTSMATAIVSGCAALYFTHHPQESNEYCKREMLFTARDLGEPWNQQGYGMINPPAFI